MVLSHTPCNICVHVYVARIVCGHAVGLWTHIYLHVHMLLPKGGVCNKLYTSCEGSTGLNEPEGSCVVVTRV